MQRTAEDIGREAKSRAQKRQELRQRIKLDKKLSKKPLFDHPAEYRRRSYEMAISQHPEQAASRFFACAQLWILSLQDILWEQETNEACAEKEKDYVDACEAMKGVNYEETPPPKWPPKLLEFLGDPLSHQLISEWGRVWGYKWTGVQRADSAV